MIRLDENDTKTKLETLFKKNLYPTAINLARSQAYNDGLIDIFTQYGDHLYRWVIWGGEGGHVWCVWLMSLMWSVCD